MKNFITIFVIMAGFAGNLAAQKYFTKTGNISFHSDTPMEKIEAVTNSATSVFDIESGKIQWAMLVKSFSFEKALMEEHFNENYMESTKFPKAKFTGSIDNPGSLNLAKDGKYNVTVSGNLEIHGISKPVTSTAEFVAKGGKITANSSIKILVADYGIAIPSLVKDKIAKEIDIKIQATYEAMAKS